MKNINFTSFLAQEMAHFVRLKQYSGSDYHSQARLLFRFDLFLVSQALKSKMLTRTIFQKYFDKINHLHSRSFANHYCVLQQFSSWLSMREKGSYVLEKRPAVDRSHSRSAYIFCYNEINAVLQTAGRYSEKKEIIAGLYKTLFSLLYCTGIRIGEALALNHSDYVKDEKLIHIKKGKFRKERYLIVSDSMAQRLNEYLQYYNAVLSPKDDSPIFVNTKKRRLSHTSTHNCFVETLNLSGIYKDKDTGPRLHDFRHTFAVHRLLQWYKTEKDINAKLPFLSTYMGHVDILSTQVYLEAANELLESGCERFHNFFLKHIK
jgi:site-specific recombinase XerD